MKKKDLKRKAIAALIASALISAPATASAESLSQEIKHKPLKCLSELAMGALTGFASHEAGHYAAAKVLGENLNFEWQDSNLVWETSARGDRLNKIAASGFLTDFMLNEQVLKKPEKNTFEKGFILYNTINHLGYALFDGKYSDIGAMEKNGLEEKYVRGFLVLHSLYTIYRMDHPKGNLDFFVKAGKRETKIGIEYRF